MKFLVIWYFRLTDINPAIIKGLFDLRAYAKDLKKQGKLELYYHIVGKHGGAWIFDVESNDELDRLIAGMPVYNYVEYNIYPLTEMKG
jgi:muconolactone delta-isomerase